MLLPPPGVTIGSRSRPERDDLRLFRRRDIARLATTASAAARPPSVSVRCSMGLQDWKESGVGRRYSMILSQRALPMLPGLLSPEPTAPERKGQELLVLLVQVQRPLVQPSAVHPAVAGKRGVGTRRGAAGRARPCMLRPGWPGRRHLHPGCVLPRAHLSSQRSAYLRARMCGSCTGHQVAVGREDVSGAASGRTSPAMPAHTAGFCEEGARKIRPAHLGHSLHHHRRKAVGGGGAAHAADCQLAPANKEARGVGDHGGQQGHCLERQHRYSQAVPAGPRQKGQKGAGQVLQVSGCVGDVREAASSAPRQPPAQHTALTAARRRWWAGRRR